MNFPWNLSKKKKKKSRSVPRKISRNILRKFFQGFSQEFSQKFYKNFHWKSRFFFWNSPTNWPGIKKNSAITFQKFLHNFSKDFPREFFRNLTMHSFKYPLSRYLYLHSSINSYESSRHSSEHSSRNYLRVPPRMPLQELLQRFLHESISNSSRDLSSVALHVFLGNASVTLWDIPLGTSIFLRVSHRNQSQIKIFYTNLSGIAPEVRIIFFFRILSMKYLWTPPQLFGDFFRECLQGFFL